MSDPSAPVLTQMLPSGIAPEGAIAIPSHGLFITANVADLIEDGGIRNHVVIYAHQNAPATYPKESVETGWVGLSEIVAHGDGVYVIERDNQIGENATIKRIYRIGLDHMVPAALGGTLPVVTKNTVYDLLPDLAAGNGYVMDEVEGPAIFADGATWVSTDNDGTDDSSGETFFWSIGNL